MDPVTARTRLKEMLADLDRSITVLQGEYPEPGPSGYDHHPADAGANLTDADRIDAALEALQRQRAEVVAAIERVEAGAYGRCVDCGKQVPEGRLDARPEAARDVNCQSRRDRRR